MKIVIAVLIFALTAVYSNHALDYSDLETLGVSCPLKDSCSAIVTANFTQRNCECDDLCGAFRDCCIDVQVPMTPRRYSRLACMAYGKHLDIGAYVLDICPRSYRSSAVVRSKCEDQGDFTDPLVSVPVTDTSASVTFRNRYCAECNNAPPSNLKTWLIYLDCQSQELRNLNHSFIWDNLVYIEETNAWGVQLEEHFQQCDLVFDKPDYITEGIRLCRTNVVSTCPPTWRRRTIKRACESYMAVLYGGNNVTYRNAHCAICNNQSVSDMFCSSAWVSGRAKKPFSFALLLDVNRSDGDVVGVRAKCPSGQKYDPFFKKCRTLVCALPGFTMVNGKCKKT